MQQRPSGASFGNLYHLPPFYAVFEDVYRQLYWLYGLCNHYGWSGTLPPVAMILNRSKRPTHVAGYANPQATAVNGQVCCGISLTLNICARTRFLAFCPSFFVPFFPPSKSFHLILHFPLSRCRRCGRPSADGDCGIMIGANEDFCETSC